MSDDQDIAGLFLAEALEASGLKASQLAKKVGLAPSTLTRTGSDTKHVMSLKTALAISRYTGVPLPQVAPRDPFVSEVIQDRYEVAWLRFWRRLDDAARKTMFRTMRIDPPPDAGDVRKTA